MSLPPRALPPRRRPRAGRRFAADPRHEQMRRLRRAGVILVTLALVFALVRACLGGGSDAAQTQATPQPPTAPAATSTRSGAASPSRQTTPSRPATPSRQATPPREATGSQAPLPAGVTRDANGFPRSSLASTKKYTMSDVAAGGTAPGARTWILAVETSVKVDPDATARQIQSILDDERSWRGRTRGPGAGERFRLVSKAAQAQLTIRLVSPDTVDALCPLNTHGLWSCAAGNQVFVNADRWLYSTPAYAGEPLAEYRAYLINHEVGHILGNGHVTCGAAGQPAPVMMQQSKSLGGCRPNAWPSVR